MSKAFQFVALSAERFTPLLGLADDALKSLEARRVVVDEFPGFPCRVSLTDAPIGETVLLLYFTHHDVASPYRASGPIIVRPNVQTAMPSVGEIPLMFRHRLLSIRGYDREAMLVNSSVTQGTELEDSIDRMFAGRQVDYLHIHNAKPGCFNCRVNRA